MSDGIPTSDEVYDLIKQLTDLTRRQRSEPCSPLWLARDRLTEYAKDLLFEEMKARRKAE